MSTWKDVECGECEGTGHVAGDEECAKCSGRGFVFPWGLTCGVRKTVALGARAIFQGFDQIDIVWNRQALIGGTEEQRNILANWLVDWGIPLLKKLCKEESLLTSDHRLVSTQVHDWCIMANPRKSLGYLYIGVCPVDGVDMPKAVPPPPRGKVDNARRLIDRADRAGERTGLRKLRGRL